MERTEGGLELLQMALCFQQMKRKIWKKKGRDHTDERRGRGKDEKVKRRGEGTEDVSSEGICPTLV